MSWFSWVSSNAVLEESITFVRHPEQYSDRPSGRDSPLHRAVGELCLVVEWIHNGDETLGGYENQFKSCLRLRIFVRLRRTEAL